jgi:predicted glycoside hydrolase/deacetylase ChbG (UPF0249 family)
VGLLIVNGDDFGLTPGVTHGIADAFRAGVLRSTSMLAVAPAFDLAASVAASGNVAGLGIGAHLALVGEDPPLLSAREVPSLVGRRGDFPASWRQFLARASARRVDPADVRRELNAQLDRLAAAGIHPTHLDTHQHLHLWPLVRGVVLDLAVERGIGAVRVPGSAAGGAVGRVVRHRAVRLRQAAAAAGLATPDRFAGLDEGGGLDGARLCEVVSRLGEGLAAAGAAELGCHPGRAVDPERRRYRWGYAWPEELDALRSPLVRRAIDGAGLRLGSFAELGAVARTDQTEQTVRAVRTPAGGSSA